MVDAALFRLNIKSWWDLFAQLWISLFLFESRYLYIQYDAQTGMSSNMSMFSWFMSLYKPSIYSELEDEERFKNRRWSMLVWRLLRCDIWSCQAFFSCLVLFRQFSDFSLSEKIYENAMSLKLNYFIGISRLSNYSILANMKASQKCIVVGGLPGGQNMDLCCTNLYCT